MYTYKSAVVRERGKNTIFKSVDVGSKPYSEILETYVDGYIVMTNPLLVGDRYISLKKLRASKLPYNDYALTFWLQTIGAVALPELDNVPTIEMKRIAYASGIQAGYRVNRVHPTNNPSASVPDASKTDLLLTRPGLDTADFYQHAMVTVGGLFYRTDNTAHGIRIKDAGKNIEVSGAPTDFGILSFKNVAALEFITILHDMLAHNTVNAPYKQEVIIQTGIDATGKSPMMVIGGYLHLNDSVFDVIEMNPLTIRVNTRKLSLFQRFYESKRLKPMDHLALTTNEEMPGVLLVDEFLSDFNIEIMLTELNSFIVLVDTPILYYKKHSLNTPLIPGTFETHEFPAYPIRTTFGRMPEPLLRVTPGYTEETKRYVLLVGVEDNSRPNYLFDTYTWETETIVDDSLALPKVRPFANAHLFEIGSQVVNFLS